MELQSGNMSGLIFFSKVYIIYVDFESKRQTNSEALYVATFCSFCIKYVTEVKHTVEVI